MEESIHLHTDHLPWEPSETPGVFYKSLRYDRTARSGAVLIRMDAHTAYPEHEHTQGEEFLVLEGELIIDGMRYPKGAYVYSPPRSVHHPRSETGAVLFAVFHGKIINRKPQP